ncbi:MAG TPA: hypothetical protein VGU71_04210 [Candidatus Dormibacteraeota bacterium]|nr:hypothetical protein [Candidatus Dormibacteraeota bacterium]
MRRVAGQSSREGQPMTPEIETASAEEPSVTQDVEATLRDVRAFLNDPVALIERALDVLRLANDQSRGPF